MFVFFFDHLRCDSKAQKILNALGFPEKCAAVIRPDRLMGQSAGCLPPVFTAVKNNTERERSSEDFCRIRKLNTIQRISSNISTFN